MKNVDNKEQYINEYYELEKKEREIWKRKKELAQMMSKFDSGDIVVINNPHSKYHGKKGYVVDSIFETTGSVPFIIYKLRRILKDGRIGDQTMGPRYYSFCEEFLEPYNGQDNGGIIKTINNEQQL